MANINKYEIDPTMLDRAKFIYLAALCAWILISIALAVTRPAQKTDRPDSPTMLEKFWYVVEDAGIYPEPLPKTRARLLRACWLVFFAAGLFLLCLLFLSWLERSRPWLFALTIAGLSYVAAVDKKKKKRT
eukprot:g6640.t1